MILAINGGKKIRNKPFPSQLTISVQESAAINQVLKNKILSGYRGNFSSNFWGGEYVQKLEKKICTKFNIKYALAVNSCTSALQIACGAIGLQPGDEVIVTPWSMSCSATAPLVWGAVPIFADIEKDYFCLDPKSIESKITKKTKAIIVVDLFGQMYAKEINDIANKYNLFIIEDAAQSIGATCTHDIIDKSKKYYAGGLGHIGCYSFTQGKHITAGEGGMIVTNNSKLMEKAALIRNHAEAVINDMPEQIQLENYMSYNFVGFNMRMTEIQAAILIEQLDKLGNFITNRIKISKDFIKLENIPYIKKYPVRKNYKHVYYCLPFKYNGKEAPIHRDIFINAVKAELTHEDNRIDRGIPISCGYIKPLNDFPIFKAKLHWALKNNRYSINNTPVAKYLYEDELFLTLYHALPLNGTDIKDIIDAFFKVHENIEELI